jgi:putative glutamine amidotransferase
VALGGSMYQDIATQQPSARVHRDGAVYDQLFHRVSFVPDSGLARLYPGKTGGRVNSVHHQAAKAIGKDLVVEARADEDGVVEALRLESDRYVFGVQWHPEFHDPKDGTLLDSSPLLTEYLGAIAQRR